MKHTKKKLPGSRVELEVNLTDAEFQKHYQPLFDEAAKKVQIKGFRPGTAPKEMLAQGVDHEHVFRSAIQEAVKFSLDEIKSGEDWSLIDHPSVEVLSSDNGITYKATLTLFPEVELGNYQKIAKKVFSEKKELTVTEEEKQKTIEWLRNSRATTVAVTRPAKTGDLVEMDLVTTSGGKLVGGSSFKGERFILGESHFLKGFDEQIAGHNPGEQFTFSITTPADYWQKELQNTKLDFAVTIKSVFERTLPEFTDAFAATLGPQFKTVADLSKSIDEGLLLEKKNKELERLRLVALTEITKASKMEVPDVLIERTLDGMVTETERMLPESEKKNPEALRKELREKLRGRAKDNVASHLALYKIAQTEKLEPSKEEIEAEAGIMAVDLAKNYDYIYDRLQNQKVFKFLESQINA